MQHFLNQNAQAKGRKKSQKNLRKNSFKNSFTNSFKSLFKLSKQKQNKTSKTAIKNHQDLKTYKMKKSSKFSNLLKKIPVHPSFVLLIAWFVAMADFKGFLMFVCVVLAHELGHYFVARKQGYKLDSFFLAPYGVSLNYKEASFDSGDEIKIALAGPLVNIVFSIFAIALFWIFPSTYSFTITFVEQSLALGLFNLLPCYPLDGGRVLAGFLSQKMPRTKAIKIVVGLNLVFSSLMIIIFFIMCFINFNPTFALAGCFLLLGVIQTKFESKYKLMALLKKKTKNFSHPISFAVNSNVTLGQLIKHIEVNKFTIFYCLFEDGKTKIIDEKIALALTLEYPLSMTLAEIYSSSQDKA